MHVMGLVGLLASERDSAVRALRREEETSKRLRKEMREREALQEKACKSLKEASDLNIAQLERDIGWKMKSLRGEILREQQLRDSEKQAAAKTSIAIWETGRKILHRYRQNGFKLKIRRGHGSNHQGC